MTFDKIKYSNEVVFLSWITRRGDKTDARTLTCHDEPKENFINAILALRKDFLDILELSTVDKMVERVSVHTLNFSFKTTENVPYVIISANVITSSGQSYNINTPLKCMQYNPENENGLSLEIIKRIEYLIEKAEAYENGDRIKLQLHQENTAA